MITKTKQMFQKGEKVKTTLTGDSVFIISKCEFKNDLWYYNFQDSILTCAEYYILKTE